MTRTERAERRAEHEASKARIAEQQAEALQAFQTDTCPTCGQSVKINNAMAGWVQCSGYGAEGFRAAGSSPCSWQGFTG